MARDDDANNEVYHNLTEQSPQANNSSGGINQKWTLYLILCTLTVCTASFIFGFNIGVTNLPTPLIKAFFARNYFPDFYNKSISFEQYDSQLKDVNRQEKNYLENRKILDEAQNETVKKEASDFLENLSKELGVSDVNSIGEKLSEIKGKLNESGLEAKREEYVKGKEKVESFNTLLWTVTTALFVVGGMVGAFTSKYVCDYFGRKKGGMSCGLIPTYLSEISPAKLRGATGVCHQLCLTIGILIAQTLGFRQIMGTSELWHFLLALPLVPCLIGTLSLLLFFPESPRALLINNRDEESARQALKRLRNSNDVSVEIEEMNNEAKETKSEESTSLKELFTSAELRWPLLTGLLLQLAQQLCGINAIFFYSEGIFRRASILDEHIQYAVFLTGLINVITTIICVPLIDRLGRKPLLVYPMIVIILDFILLTVFLALQSRGPIYSYLSIVCIIVFIMCFAIGLGPIPFVYVAECFRQDARSAALAICMFTNWVANLVLTLTFPYLAELLTNYVFLIFTAIVGLTVVVIFKKVPETKGRNVEEIMAHFQGRKAPKYTPDESGKLIGNSKV
ncbi:unnamed protein product [Brachionus calyciflorus]|uniref:Major facilitator superfamily (MFS) profile domain-containing protein n=1 Tax=Brachionus calyciflorus TaxID=104777 RepID=A0A814DER1_9BILA|nr:unnamed protein product [Brachionus calyciflorus]